MNQIVAKKRKFYIGYTFVVDDGYGVRHFEGNVALEFGATTKKNVGMFQAAKEFISERFELDNPDVVSIVMFEELEE